LAACGANCSRASRTGRIERGRRRGAVEVGVNAVRGERAGVEPVVEQKLQLIGEAARHRRHRSWPRSRRGLHASRPDRGVSVRGS
jgi:hypothetical protein